MYVHLSIRAPSGQLLHSSRLEEGGSGVPMALVLGRGVRAPRGWELGLQGDLVNQIIVESEPVLIQALILQLFHSCFSVQWCPYVPSLTCTAAAITSSVPLVLNVCQIDAQNKCLHSKQPAHMHSMPFTSPQQMLHPAISILGVMLLETPADPLAVCNLINCPSRRPKV